MKKGSTSERGLEGSEDWRNPAASGAVMDASDDEGKGNQAEESVVRRNRQAGSIEGDTTDTLSLVEEAEEDQVMKHWSSNKKTAIVRINEQVVRVTGATSSSISLRNPWLCWNRRAIRQGTYEPTEKAGIKETERCLPHSALKKKVKA